MAINCSDLLKSLTPELNAIFKEEYSKINYQEEIDFGTELERVDDDYMVSERT
jgi:hypothetical protein